MLAQDRLKDHVNLGSGSFLASRAELKSELQPAAVLAVPVLALAPGEEFKRSFEMSNAAVAAVALPGLRRPAGDVSQDSFGAVDYESRSGIGSCVVVADGIGGHSHGAEMGAAATEGALAAAKADFIRPTFESVAEAVKEKLFSLIEQLPVDLKHGPGACFSSVRLEGHSERQLTVESWGDLGVFLASSGAGRQNFENVVYENNRGAGTFLDRDERCVGSCVRAYKGWEEDKQFSTNLRPDPEGDTAVFKPVIEVEERGSAEVVRRPVEKGDLLIVCSDGFWKAFQNLDEIGQLVARVQSQEFATDLERAEALRETLLEGWSETLLAFRDKALKELKELSLEWTGKIMPPAQPLDRDTLLVIENFLNDWQQGLGGVFLNVESCLKRLVDCSELISGRLFGPEELFETTAKVIKEQWFELSHFADDLTLAVLVVK